MVSENQQVVTLATPRVVEYSQEKGWTALCALACQNSRTEHTHPHTAVQPALQVPFLDRISSLLKQNTKQNKTTFTTLIYLIHVHVCVRMCTHLDSLSLPDTLAV